MRTEQNRLELTQETIDSLSVHARMAKGPPFEKLAALNSELQTGRHGMI